MKFIPVTISVFAALSAVKAQSAASDSDVATVSQQIQAVVSAVNALDTQVKAFSGPSDAATLLSGSEAVVSALNAGTSAITPISGEISIGQATGLTTDVSTLNTAVAAAVKDLDDKKSTFVSANVGSVVLDQLNKQLTAANAFRSAIAGKFSSANQGLVQQVSQPSIDSLNTAISNFQDQAGTGGSVSGASSAVAGSQAATSGNAAPATSQAAATSAGSAPVISQAAASGTGSAPAATSVKTTGTVSAATSTKTSPAMYSGAASSLNVGGLTLVGLLAAIVV